MGKFRSDATSRLIPRTLEFRNAPPWQNETWLFPASNGGADHASLISLFFGQEGLCHAYTVTFCVPMDEGRERTDGVLVHMRCLRM